MAIALMIRNEVHSITVTQEGKVTGDSAQGRTLSEDIGQGELAKHRPCTAALLLTQTSSTTQGGKGRRSNLEDRAALRATERKEAQRVSTVYCLYRRRGE